MKRRAVLSAILVPWVLSTAAAIQMNEASGEGSPILLSYEPLPQRPRWFEPSRTNYLRWYSEWHISSITPSKPILHGHIPTSCQRLRGGFFAPPSHLIARHTRPGHTQLSMAIRDRVSATSGPINWMRQKSGTSRSVSGNTVTLSRPRGSHGEDVVDSRQGTASVSEPHAVQEHVSSTTVQLPGNTILLRSEDA